MPRLPRGRVRLQRAHAARFQRGQSAAKARALARMFPHSDGARVIREMLELADPGRTLSPSFSREVRRVRAGLRRKR